LFIFNELDAEYPDELETDGYKYLGGFMSSIRKEELPEFNKGYLESKNGCIKNVSNLSDPYYPNFIRNNVSKLFKHIVSGMKALVKKS
jgi:hypothetical protein